MIPKFNISEHELLQRVQSDLDDSERYFDSVLRDEIIARYRLVNLDKTYYNEKFPRLSKKSTVVSSDIADTIEWILPSLLRIFWGGNDVVSLEGRTPEDNPEPLKQLIHWQLRVKNQGFLIFYQWFRDALESGLGIVKAWWARDFEKRTEEMVVGPEIVVQIDPKIIDDIQDVGNGQYWVRVKTRRMSVNQPRICNIPASEFLFNPNRMEDGVLPFACHRRLVTEDEIRRKAKIGIYKDVDSALSTGVTISAEYEELDQYVRDIKVSGWDTITGWGEGKDSARRRHLIHECFGRYDINNDGMLENVIVTVLGGKIIRRDINTYGRPPFSMISPYPKTYSVWGKGVPDLLQDLQDLKTALLRQIIVNIAQSNDPKAAIAADQKEGLDDLMNDRNFIRIFGKDGQSISNFLQWLPQAPLQPQSFQFLEYLEGMKENKSGVTRYNQGLDANSLNKTATGINAIMGAAAQRIELIARIFAETGVVDVFRSLVDMNQKWIEQEQVIRLTNQFLTIRPDDLAGEYDIEVSAGVGTGNKQETVQQMMLLLQNVLPSLMPFGIAGPENLYAAAKRLVEEMGYKNVGDFLRGPKPGMPPMMAGMPGMDPGMPGVPGQPPMPGPGMPGQPPMVPPQPPMPPQ